jgi:small basic protein (TIGR04137 family)
MSIDRSLKTAGGLTRHRNVLTRDERIAKLAEQGQFDTQKDDPIGLPKVGNRKVVAAGKTKKKKAGEEESEEETK